jgi:hypothetical protein
VHGINAPSVTAHKPPFPNSRIMLLISISLSITKFQPEPEHEHEHEKKQPEQNYASKWPVGRAHF